MRAMPGTQLQDRIIIPVYDIYIYVYIYDIYCICAIRVNMLHNLNLLAKKIIQMRS